MAFNPTKAREYIQPEEYVALADVMFIVDDSKLPAHSQVGVLQHIDSHPSVIPAN